MPAAIQQRRVLLVEGQDEVRFFEALLRQIGISDVQVVEVGGKDRFPNEFPALRNDAGFAALEAYAIIRDADVSSASALQSVCSLLEKYGEPCPKEHGHFASDCGRKVGIFIMPGNREQGMLEDLCLQSVEDHPVMLCVSEFMNCLGQVLPREGTGDKVRYPRNEAKARVLAFLAGMPEAVSSLGLAAQKGFWRLDHEALTPLRLFLEELVA